MGKKIFDLLCDVVEAHHPYFLSVDVRSLVSSSRLFLFDKPAHEFLRKDVSQEEADAIVDHDFFLPFKSTALEDPASVVILGDVHPNVVGSKTARVFCECIPFDVDRQAFREQEYIETFEHFINQFDIREKHVCMVTTGMVSITNFVNDQWQIEGCAFSSHICTPKKMYASYDVETDDGKRTLRAINAHQFALTNPATALQEVMYFNSPEFFVLKEQPEKKRNKGRKKRKRKWITRSDQRDLYTILSPKEIRERMHPPEPEAEEGAKKRPHERRAHLRHYRSDRYVNMKGKTQVIPATWIGPQESVHGGRRYKVITDLTRKDIVDASQREIQEQSECHS